MHQVSFTSVILLRATPRWLALSRTERRAMAAACAAPVFADFAARMQVRWVDVEAFTARCSDLLLCSMASVLDQHALLEALRDTKLFGEGYFELVDVLFGLDEGYRWYEEQTA